MGEAGRLALCLAPLFTVAAGANWKEIELYIPQSYEAFIKGDAIYSVALHYPYGTNYVTVARSWGRWRGYTWAPAAWN